jgi:hypothetical protein
MTNPENVSTEYRYILGHDVLFPPTEWPWGTEQSTPTRKELEVSPEEIDRFLAQRTLESQQLNGQLIGTAMFFVQAIVKLRHPANLVPHGSYYLEDDSSETISGNKHPIHAIYVPIELKDGITTFAPLDEIGNDGQPITEHTAEVARRTSAGGRFGNALTRKILPLIDN